MDPSQNYPTHQPDPSPTPPPLPSGVDPYYQPPVAADPGYPNPAQATANIPAQVPIPAPGDQPTAPWTPQPTVEQPARDKDHSQYSAYEFPSFYQPPATPPTTPPVVAPPAADLVPLPAAPSYAEMPASLPPQPAAVPPEPYHAPTPTTEPTYEQPAPLPPTAPATVYAEQPPVEATTPTPPPQPAEPAPLPALPEAVAPPPQPFAGLPTEQTPPPRPVASGAISYLPGLDKLQERLKKTPALARDPSVKKRLKPIISAAVLGVLVYGVFNSQLLLGQLQYLLSPRANAGDATSFDPSQAVSSKPEIIIPKINLRAPVVYSVKTFNEGQVQKALEKGVVHYGDTGLPGVKGNNVIVGHSSNNWWASGKYKFAFVLLNKLEEGDIFYLHYNSRRYTYEVSGKKIVAPQEVGVISQRASTPQVTLITCDPPGTSWKRLVVVAKQIEPDPAKAKAQSSAKINEAERAKLPGDGESLINRLRDLF